MWMVGHNFKEGKKSFRRGDIIKKKPDSWKNFDSMVNTGTLILMEETKEIKTEE